MSIVHLGRSGCLLICTCLDPFCSFETSCLDRQLLTLHTASRAPGLRKSVSLGAPPTIDQTQGSAWVFPLFTRLSTASISFLVLSVLVRGARTGRYLVRQNRFNSLVNFLAWIQDSEDTPVCWVRMSVSASAHVWRAASRTDRGLCGRIRSDSVCLAGVEGAGTCLGHRSPPPLQSTPDWLWALVIPSPPSLPCGLALPGRAVLLLVSESLHAELSPWDACAPCLFPGNRQSVSGSWCWSCLYQFVLASCASRQCPLQDSTFLLNLGHQMCWRSLVTHPACPAYQDFHWALAWYLTDINWRLENFSESTPAVGVHGDVKHLEPLPSGTPPGSLSIPASSTVPLSLACPVPASHLSRLLCVNPDLTAWAWQTLWLFTVGVYDTINTLTELHSEDVCFLLILSKAEWNNLNSL